MANPGAGGAEGLLHQQLALKKRASTLIAVGHSDLRLDVARPLGATGVINSRDRIQTHRSARPQGDWVRMR